MQYLRHLRATRADIAHLVVDLPRITVNYQSAPHLRPARRCIARWKGTAMIQDMFDWGAMPALERVVQYTSARHKLLTHNIANLSTPNFQPLDVDPAEFEKALAEAVESRRRTGGPTGELEIRDTRTLQFDSDDVHFRPQATHDNLLFHDRNDRSVEHMMQALAENTGAHNAALEILRNQFQLLQSAIQERP